MSGHAIQRLVRQSPRKMRLVIDLIRGKDVNEAYAILKFNKKLAAQADRQDAQVGGGQRGAEGAPGQRAVRPGHARRQQGDVDGGRPLKRFTAAAQGRATPIRKRTSHVEIHVATRENE